MMLDLKRLAFRNAIGTAPKPQETRASRLLWIFLAGFYITWTAWALFLARHPGIDHSGSLRAAVRLLVWVVPALGFVRWVEGPFVLSRVGLLRRPGFGLAIGLTGSILPIGLALLRTGFRPTVTPPTDLATWLNPILTAPLAEELLFRGLVFRVLCERFRLLVAVMISAVLFALIHLPYWWLTQAPGALAVNLISMTAYGVFFALLYQYSGSLWAPLLCHFLNNFANISLSPR